MPCRLLGRPGSRAFSLPQTPGGHVKALNAGHVGQVCPVSHACLGTHAPASNKAWQVTGTDVLGLKGHSFKDPDLHAIEHHVGARHSDILLHVQALARLHPAGLADDWADKLAGQGFFSRAQKATFEHYMQVCAAPARCL